MLVPYVTITNIALYESDEKFADIWLFIKNTLKNWRLFDSVRDNLWRCTIVMDKRGVCKVTGTIFLCCENENNLKNIFAYFGGLHDHFYPKIVI